MNFNIRGENIEVTPALREYAEKKISKLGKYFNEELAQDEQEHDHQNPTAAAMTNHIVANLAVLWTKLHQYHWYVKGPHFFTLHEKFEELYNDASKWYDEIAETLLAMGAKPFSTTEQNLKYAMVEEDGGDKYRSAEEMVETIIDDFRMNRDVATGFKAYLDKQIWMLQAYLSKTALEDEE